MTAPQEKTDEEIEQELDTQTKFAYIVPGPNGRVLATNPMKTEYGIATPVLTVFRPRGQHHVFCAARDQGRGYGDTYSPQIVEGGALAIREDDDVVMMYAPGAWDFMEPWPLTGQSVVE